MPSAKKARKTPSKKQDPMEEWVQRWIMKPLLIAVAVIVGLSVVAILAGFPDLPPWAFALPGVPVLGGYYYLEGRKVWHLHFGGGATTQTATVEAGGQSIAVQKSKNVSIHLGEKPKPSKIGVDAKLDEDQVRVLRRVYRATVAGDSHVRDSDLVKEFGWTETYAKGVLRVLKGRGEIETDDVMTNGEGGYSVYDIRLTQAGHHRLDATATPS
ncbi:MAG: hypothetical protein ACYC2H_13280 [Thermoplasmatota archaeon]